MADLTQAYDALKKADAAGNSEDAKKLADYIRTQSAEQKPATPEKPQSTLDKAKGFMESARPTEDFDPQATEAQMGQFKVAPDVAKGVAAGALGAMASATGESQPDIDARNQKLGLVTNNPMANQLGGMVGSLVAPLPTGEVGSAAVARAGNTARAARPIAQAGANFTPETAAKEYIKKLGLDWTALTDKFRSTLKGIAQDSTSLDKLDPEAVKRKARLDAQGLPASRGQVTRDLSQLTSEENITKSAAGAPIRDINAEQDRILHQHLDTLRGKTGGTAATQQQVGKSVQGALRQKLRDTKASASKAYELANTLGENEITTVKPLQDFLTRPINDANVGWVKSRIEKLANPDGSISLKNLEDIRQELTFAAKNPDKGGHYASEAAKVIDGIMDDAGSDAYKNARQGWKAMKDEFDKQGRVKKLVSEKGLTQDRATALEDTFDTAIRKGSVEDIEKVRKSLTTGKGNVKTLAQGQQAWRDLQGATIDYLKEKAGGKRGITGEKGNLQFNSTFIDAVHELDSDGKLDVIFSKPIADQIRKLSEVTRDVRTKPSGRIAGSDTAPRVLNFLEKLSMVPVIGKYAAGVGKVGQKIAGMGEETRQVAQAKSDPFEEAAAKSSAGASSQKRKSTLRDLGHYIPRAAQLADQDNQ